MNPLIISLIAVVVTALVAFLIVQFSPKAEKPLKITLGVVSILSFTIACFLVWKIYNGIMEPIKFDKEKQIRYAKVVNNLKLIRKAEEMYKKVYNNYTEDKGSLVGFIQTGKLPITETKNVDKTVNLGGGITKVISVRKVDTVGYEKVINSFKGKDYGNMFKVPGTDKEFKLGIGEKEKVEGLIVPVFEAKIEKTHVLKGMNENLIKQEIKAKEADQIKGEYVSVGSLKVITVAGNWPPSYDNQIDDVDTKK